MDWDKLKIFYTVAEAGSFTNATINLNLSQSAISRQIQSLEEDLNVKLFERHARGLTLTENGEYVFKTAHEVISKLKEVETSLGDQKNKPSGKLTVTTVVTVSLPCGLSFLSPKVVSTSFSLLITSWAVLNTYSPFSVKVSPLACLSNNFTFKSSSKD